MSKQTRQLKKVPVQTEAPQHSEPESTFQNQMSGFIISHKVSVHKQPWLVRLSDSLIRGIYFTRGEYSDQTATFKVMLNLHCNFICQIMIAPFLQSWEQTHFY